MDRRRTKAHMLNYPKKDVGTINFVANTELLAPQGLNTFVKEASKMVYEIEKTEVLSAEEEARMNIIHANGEFYKGVDMRQRQKDLFTDPAKLQEYNDFVAKGKKDMEELLAKAPLGLSARRKTTEEWASTLDTVNSQHKALENEHIRNRQIATATNQLESILSDNETIIADDSLSKGQKSVRLMDNHNLMNQKLGILQRLNVDTVELKKKATEGLTKGVILFDLQSKINDIESEYGLAGSPYDKVQAYRTLLKEYQTYDIKSAVAHLDKAVPYLDENVSEAMVVEAMEQYRVELGQRIEKLMLDIEQLSVLKKTQDMLDQAENLKLFNEGLAENDYRKIHDSKYGKGSSNTMTDGEVYLANTTHDLKRANDLFDPYTPEVVSDTRMKEFTDIFGADASSKPSAEVDFPALVTSVKTYLDANFHPAQHGGVIKDIAVRHGISPFLLAGAINGEPNGVKAMMDYQTYRDYLTKNEKQHDYAVAYYTAMQDDDPMKMQAVINEAMAEGIALADITAEKEVVTAENMKRAVLVQSVNDFRRARYEGSEALAQYLETGGKTYERDALDTQNTGRDRMYVGKSGYIRDREGNIRETYNRGYRGDRGFQETQHPLTGFVFDEEDVMSLFGGVDGELRDFGLNKNIVNAFGVIGLTEDDISAPDIHNESGTYTPNPRSLEEMAIITSRAFNKLVQEDPSIMQEIYSIALSLTPPTNGAVSPTNLSNDAIKQAKNIVIQKYFNLGFAGGVDAKHYSKAKENGYDLRTQFNANLVTATLGAEQAQGQEILRESNGALVNPYIKNPFPVDPDRDWAVDPAVLKEVITDANKYGTKYGIPRGVMVAQWYVGTMGGLEEYGNEFTNSHNMEALWQGFEDFDLETDIPKLTPDNPNHEELILRTIITRFGHMYDPNSRELQAVVDLYRKKYGEIPNEGFGAVLLDGGYEKARYYNR